MKEKYCRFCGEAEKEIRKEDRKCGGRLPCVGRDTKRGFHSYRYRDVQESKVK